MKHSCDFPDGKRIQQKWTGSHVSIGVTMVQKNNSHITRPKNSTPASAYHDILLEQIHAFQTDVNSVRVSEHQYDRVASEEHLTDISVLVHRPGLLYSLAWLGHLRPHFLHVLQHHVAMSVEGLHSRQQLVIISAIYQHLEKKQKRFKPLIQIISVHFYLCVLFDTLHEHRQRTSLKFLLFVFLFSRCVLGAKKAQTSSYQISPFRISQVTYLPWH